MPFGYCIHNGKAVIYREEAEKNRNAHSLYLSGCGYDETARKAELNMPKRENLVGSIASKFKFAPMKAKFKDPYVQAAYVVCSKIERAV